MVEVYHEISGHRGLLVTLADRTRAAWDFHLKTAENDSGTLYLSTLRSNPEFSYLQPLASELVIEQDGVERWRGRYLKDFESMPGIVQITTKGCLDYFRDSVQDAAKLSGSSSAALQHIVAVHNAKPLEVHKKFSIGVIEVDVQLEDFLISAGDKSWDCIKRLVKACGGKISLRRVDGVNLIDWLKGSTHTCSQRVQIGVNLLDISRATEVDRLATVLYLYGKTIDDNETTVASVNNGEIYIKDEDAVALFGWIEDSFRDRSIEDPALLLERGHEELEQRLSATTAVTLRAIDFGDQKMCETIEVGMLVDADLHDGTLSLPCTEVDRYFYDPRKTKISLGSTFKTLSAMIGGNI